MKLVIGFITYKDMTAKYLPYFLPSLKNQALKDCEIIAFDNSEDQDDLNIKYLHEYNIAYERAGKNIGFARAYNKLIRQAVDWQADYFLVLNPDMLVEPGAIQRMADALELDENLGSVCPKILKWDFKNNKKTKIIDSCGLREISALRFADLAQGEEDHGQCEAKKIIGSSGAAAMYRISSLERAEEGDKYFDENFFMYKEDCDLAYRLCLAGFKSKCVSDAIIYHDRTAAAKGNSNFKIILNRRSKNKQIKKWSFSGQQYMFLKYWKLQNFKQKLEIFWYAFRMFIFVLLFEQYLLGQYISLWQKRKKIKFRPALAGVSKS